MKNKLMIVAMILVIIIFSTACSNKNNNAEEPVTGKDNSIMGTETVLTVYGERAQEAIDKAWEIMKDIEQKMSLNIDSSEINEINRQAGKKAVKVSEETFHVIKKGIYFSELTEGRFDITIAPITKLWNIGDSDKQRVPSEKEIQERLSLVGYQNITIDEENQTVFLEKEGMEIDLGGIAKGYAADRVVETFKEMGIENALANVGGNIKGIGENPKREGPWIVGVRNPRGPRGDSFATLGLENGETVVSSGDYERFFIENDVRYHHIFNAQVGQPSDSDIIGVSIFTDNSMEADGLSTSVFLLGSQEGLKFIEDMDGVEAVIVTSDLKIIMTDGIENRLEILETQL